MADENVCQQFEPHAWKKDLCVKCMKARSVHKSLHQVPVPVKRKTKTTSNDPDIGGERETSSNCDVPNDYNKPASSAPDARVPDRGGSKDKPEREVTGKKQIADPGNNLDRKKSGPTALAKKTAAGNIQKDGGKKSPGSAQSKPAVATKPRPPGAKARQAQDKQQSGAPDAAKGSTTEDRDHRYPVPVPRSTVAESDNSDKAIASCGPTAAVTNAKSKAKVNVPTRPPGAPPDVPRHNDAPTERKSAKVSKTNDTRPVKVHIKGLTPETVPSTETKQQDIKDTKHPHVNASVKSDNIAALNDPNCKDAVAPSRGSSSNGSVVTSGGKEAAPPTGSGHYYHKYDVTGSLQRKTKKPVDKRTVYVKDDLQLRTKKTLVMPYTVVDVTSVRRECDNGHPPQLPSTPPPDHTASEPTSRESTLRSSKHKTELGDAESADGSQNSVKSEPLPSPKLPIILQAEAQRMREESRTPPPHRMVPIMIRPQHSDGSDTYEPVEDYQRADEVVHKDSKNVAESTEGLTTDADFVDYSTTDVGCLSFGRQSKSRASATKSNVFEAKMAALANLDLLKGITSKVQAPDISVEQVTEVDAPGTGTSAKTEEQVVPVGHQESQKVTKKGGKSFFKKLLKIGSREGGGSSNKEVTGDDPSGGDSGITHPSNVMVHSAYDEHSGSSAQSQRMSPTRHEKMMLSEVQKVIANRQFSAPDICRELTDLKNLEQKPLDVSCTTGVMEQPGHQAAVSRSKKKLNITVQPIISAPNQDEKINNIKQAQLMALSLGIDKMTSRHKGDEPITSTNLSGAAPNPLASVPDQVALKLRDGSKEETYMSDSRSQEGVKSSEVTGYGSSSSSATPDANSTSSSKPKPSIPAKFKKTVDSSKTEQNVFPESANLACVVAPDLSGESSDICVDRAKADPLLSPASSESSSVGYAPGSGAASPQPTSPSSELPPGVRSKKSRARADPKTGKIARSMMPAPPPPPPPPAPHQSAAMSGSVVGGQASQPTESPSRPGDHGCQPGMDPDFPVASASNTSPEHKSGTRRPGALTHTDISAPILTSPDLMSRSFSTPSTEPTSDIHRKENVECAKKHTRNKTITEGIVVEASTSPIEDNEVDFDSMGRINGRFLNRALPPTPGQSKDGKGTTKPTHSDTPTGSVSVIEENEYEMVSVDSDADDKDVDPESTERPDYEDIDDANGDEEGLYSNPADLDDDSSEQNDEAVDVEQEQDDLDDGYLEPVATNNDDEIQTNEKRILSGSRLSHPDICLTVYTNTDTSVYGQKPVWTIKEAFCKMSTHNVQTLSSRAQTILDRLIPRPAGVDAELSWGDFKLRSSTPVLRVGDIAFYAARSNRVKPSDCHVMICRHHLSKTFAESASAGGITASKVFRDEVSRDLLIDLSKSDHCRTSSTVECDISVLSYSKLESLDVAISNMDSVFATDLNEYERFVSFWITHIVGAVIDISVKWPHLQMVSCEHVAAVRVPSCEQSFPVLIIPEFSYIQSGDPDQLAALPPCNWNQIGSDIIRILFKLLRLVYKEPSKDPVVRIPIRSKYSVGLRAFVEAILKNKDSSCGIVFGKFIIEVMLWGPCKDDIKQLMTAENRDESFQIWLELKRNLIVNSLAAGYHRDTPDFSGMLSFLCSVTPKLLMDATRILWTK